jgi:hypothetical protein
LGDEDILGPEEGIMDRKHYKLLSNKFRHDPGDTAMLEESWTEWKRLGQYEFGESQRRELAKSAQAWGEQLVLFKELEIGFCGSMEQKKQFNEELKVQGMKEIRKGGVWSMFAKYLPLYETFGWPKLDYRLPDQHLHPDENPEDYLGDKIYHKNGKLIKVS